MQEEQERAARTIASAPVPAARPDSAIAGLEGCDPKSVTVRLRLHDLEAHGTGNAPEARDIVLKTAGALNWVVTNLNGIGLKARLAARALLAPGVGTQLMFAPKSMHFLDAANEAQIKPRAHHVPDRVTVRLALGNR